MNPHGRSPNTRFQVSKQKPVGDIILDAAWGFHSYWHTAKLVFSIHHNQQATQLRQLWVTMLVWLVLSDALKWSRGRSVISIRAEWTASVSSFISEPRQHNTMAISLDGVTHYVINSAGVKSMKQKLFIKHNFTCIITLQAFFSRPNLALSVSLLLSLLPLW